MNVLILTPDAVGSTLLQRMLTIYMQFHEFDRPVINLHELTNGLAKYYSPEFNRELVSKREVKNWGYHQSLNEVVELLSSVDHYKTARLAHYYIVRRGDTVDQQIPFYNYLNENFYVIACRRANVFEHAISMTLNCVTKKLNVYTPHEKIEAFYDLYQHGVTLDTDVLTAHLESYKQYLNWSEQYFNIGSYFHYERDVPELEKFILNLPVFVNQRKFITWNEQFDISFNEWNKIHYHRSDVNWFIDQQINLESLPLLIENYHRDAPQNWPSVHTAEDIELLPDNLKQEFKSIQLDNYRLTQSEQLLELKQKYQSAAGMIAKMVEIGILESGPPIKKQTLAEKQNILKNFDRCVEVYNCWAEKNTNIATTIDQSCLNLSITHEQNFWHNSNNITLTRQ
jgi:hypothetical protein